jgi:hypothetical protein
MYACALSTMPRTPDAGEAHLGEAVLRVDDEQTCLAASTCSVARSRPVRNKNAHDGVPSPTTTSFFFTSGLRAAILDDDGSIALAVGGWVYRSAGYLHVDRTAFKSGR